MNLFRLSWSNLVNKPLSTLLSLLLLTLGVGLISMLLLLNEQLSDKFKKNIRGVDMVVGAKGSPLQLILSSVYQIDYPTGNIPLSEAERVLRNPMVKSGIPLSYGDSYRSYRIVGSKKDYIDLYEAKVAKGRLWEKPFEATIGGRVAQDLNLQIGDTFASAHGFTDDEIHEDQLYTVVGVLEANNSVLDQLLLTSLESVWQIHDHDHGEEGHEDHKHEHGEEGHDHHDYDHGEEGHEHHEHDHHDHAEGEGHDHEHDHHHHDHAESPKEITALLVKFKSPMGMISLPRAINEKSQMQAALPSIEVSRLLKNLGFGMDALRAMAMAIIFIAGLSVFIALYNSLQERRYEMALMRSLGAAPIKLFWMVVMESLILALIGFTLGLLMSRIGLWLMSTWASSSYHYNFNSWTFHPQELWLLGATLFLAFLAALIPAIQAFKTNISQQLSNH